MGVSKTDIFNYMYRPAFLLFNIMCSSVSDLLAFSLKITEEASHANMYFYNMTSYF